MLDHAGQFHHPAQLDLPPPAAHLGLPQGLHEVGRFPLEPGLGLRERADLFRERPVSPLALRLDLPHHAFDLAQRLLQRLHHVVDRLAFLPQGLARQLEERFAVRLQGLPGEGLERFGHPAARVLQQRQFRFGGPGLFLHPGGERGTFGLETPDRLPEVVVFRLLPGLLGFEAVDFLDLRPEAFFEPDRLQAGHFEFAAQTPEPAHGEEKRCRQEHEGHAACRQDPNRNRHPRTASPGEKHPSSRL